MSRKGGRSRPRARSTRDSRADRGVSEVTGAILLFGIVMAAIAIILLTNAAVQDGLREDNRLDSATVTMAEVDSRLGTLSYDEGANLTGIDFPSGTDERVSVRESSSSVTFVLNEQSACTASVDLGAIQYTEDDGAAVAYESGAIWRRSGENVTMVQPPDFEFRNGTVTFAAKRLEGEIHETSTVFADRDYERSQALTEEFEEDLLTGPGGNPETCMLRRNLTITVESQYYQGWAEFFREEFGSTGTITVDDANQRVRVFLAEDEFGPFDSDGDGTPDEEDNCPREFNPGQEDLDGDGDGDVCDSDDDGDDVPDDEDNCQKNPNEDQRDTDGDGVGDVCDPDVDGDGVANDEEPECFKEYNPSQRDTDGDGRPDACDRDDDNDGVDDPWHTGPGEEGDNCPRIPNSDQDDLDDGGRGDECDPDDDGDDVPDVEDNCPATPNPDQADSDDDGRGDACETRPEDDYDDDGVPNGADNCPTTPNPGQRNTDRNRYGGTDNPRGDACDPDDDGDGVLDPDVASDSGDNCPRTWNPDQRDTDDDGTGDACDNDDDDDGVDDVEDNCPKVPNSDQVDSDGDGRGDACEEDTGSIPDHDGRFVDVQGVDATEYREVTAYVTVDTEAGRDGDLTADDFRVFEDTAERNVTNVAVSGSGAVDVVFVFDDTSSMDDYISSMKENVRGFTEALDAAGVDARYGLISFGDGAEYDQRPTRDIGEFQRAVDRLDARGGGDTPEASVAAIYAAATATDWRSDAQRVIIHVTDAPSHEYRSVEEAVAALEDTGATFYTVSPPNERGVGRSRARQIARAVDGEWMNIRGADSFEPFLDDIETDLTTRYAVTFETCLGADGSDRDLAVLADDPEEGLGRGDGEYTAPDGSEANTCRDARPDPDPVEPDPRPDPPRPRVPGGGDPTDDDRRAKRPPECDANETPDWRPGLPDDPLAMPDPNGDGVRGCYPSQIPEYPTPEPPEPYTNVVNVNVDLLEVDNAGSDDD